MHACRRTLVPMSLFKCFYGFCCFYARDIKSADPTRIQKSFALSLINIETEQFEDDICYHSITHIGFLLVF